MSQDDEDLVPPVPLPADEVTAHIAVMVQALNTVNRNVRDLRIESRDRDTRTGKRLELIEGRLTQVEIRPTLTAEQRDLVADLEEQQRNDGAAALHVAQTRRGDLPIYVVTGLGTLVSIVGFILKLTGHL